MCSGYRDVCAFPAPASLFPQAKLTASLCPATCAGQTVCSDYQDAYKAHKARLMAEYRTQIDEVKAKVRRQYAASVEAQQGQ